jgi:uncharacterized membrane protein YkvA (DUF1232 family)
LTLYGVTTKRFNEQVRSNCERFPADFMFQLSAQEAEALRSQIATSNALPRGRGGRRYLPYAFTEHGAIMAASILNSSRAVEMSVYVVRAFVKLRELLASNKELARRFAQLETRLDKKLFAHDEAIALKGGFSPSFCLRVSRPQGVAMRRLFRLWRLSGQDLRLLWMALRNPNRPRWLVPALIALGFFALEPFNFAIPFLGIVDDVFLLPLLLRVLAKFAVPVTRVHIDPRARDERVVSVQ